MLRPAGEGKAAPALHASGRSCVGKMRRRLRRVPLARTPKARPVAAVPPIRRVAATALSTPQFPAALRRDAGRRGGQYRAAIGDAGDRAGDRHRRFLGRHRLHLVGGAVGAAGALLGGKKRPPRAQGADPDGHRRLHRLDAAVRAGPGRRAARLDRRRR